MKHIGNFTCFFSKDDLFSNWHPCSFTMDGREFNCGEQAMMFHKAILFGDQEIAAKIMRSSNPKEQKALGRQVRNYDEATWVDHRLDLMVKISVARFSQNEEMQRLLLSTHGTTLVEASPYDLVWGVGLSENDSRITDRSQWKGTNLLGIALEVTRDKLTPKEKMKTDQSQVDANHDAPSDGRMIAVIGTAGRDASQPKSKALWQAMCADLRERLTPTDHLISGGAAWSDHLAVHAFTQGWVSALTLHLPAPLGPQGFVGPNKSAASAANYYHQQFSQVIGQDSYAQILSLVNHPGVTLTYEPAAPGYGAMFARNKKVAAQSNACVAYTFGDADNQPADGGTLNTWNQINSIDKVHVPLHGLIEKMSQKMHQQQATNAPTPDQDDQELASFSNILNEEIGARFKILNQINERIAQIESVTPTQEGLLKTIGAIDVILAQHAHEHRYSVDEQRDEVIDEVAQWARLRTLIAQEILPNLPKMVAQEQRSPALQVTPLSIKPDPQPSTPSRVRFRMPGR